MTSTVERKDIEKYAHLASYQEIEQNGFNLNIPRYVDSSEEEEQIDIQATLTDLAKLDRKESEVNALLEKYFQELGIVS